MLFSKHPPSVADIITHVEPKKSTNSDFFKGDSLLQKLTESRSDSSLFIMNTEHSKLGAKARVLKIFNTAR